MAFFWLSEEEIREVHRQRESQNRLGYALQLCTLRYLGFVPDDLQATPPEGVTFVAEQLAVTPPYSQRTPAGDGPRPTISFPYRPTWDFGISRPLTGMLSNPGMGC